ncbi:hypothetical protein [Streptomyces sp. WMMB 322]|uniref:hypothetical protein n=1 Tax=Streptomyces sp. WMMB 322 TaxID=1286821 RepID=UPI0006E40343|nr:hypothetical protein [Streptomyces sp. WMMB 322]SCK12625.1 hypothetical protein H180DRAFT_00740 [Streptomyces sp. WMMB 322]
MPQTTDTATTTHHRVSTDEVYADAPSIEREIASLAELSERYSHDSALPREFWLRKAALVDRIALTEVSTYGPELAKSAIQAAEAAAVQLIAYDAKHGSREYVRNEYRRWSLTEDS